MNCALYKVHNSILSKQKKVYYEVTILGDQQIIAVIKFL